MYDLTTDINGDPIEVHPRARFLRIRKQLGGRGAPPLVMNKDRTPKLLPIDAGFPAFHEAVAGEPGPFTLYQCDEHGRPIKEAAKAFIDLGETAAASGTAAVTAAAGALGEAMALLRETMAANTSMAREAMGKHAEITEATSGLIRSITGTGLLQRAEPDDDEDDDTDEAAPSREPTVWEVIAKELRDPLQMFAAIKMKQAGGGAPVKAAKAAPATKTSPATAQANAAPPPTEASQPSEPAVPPTAPAAEPAPESSEEMGVPTMDQIGHLMLIKSQLTEREQRVVDAAIGKLTPAKRAEYIAELCARSVEEAVAYVRQQIAESRSTEEPKGDAS